MMCETNHSLVNKIMVNYSLFVDERLYDKGMKYTVKDASWGLYLRKEKQKETYSFQDVPMQQIQWSPVLIIWCPLYITVLPLWQTSHKQYLKTTQIYHCTLKTGLTGLNSRWGQGCIPFWKPYEFSPYLDCRQNSVSRGRRSEISFFLLAISWGLLPVSRGSWLPSSIFKASNNKMSHSDA